jgi:hypothetical protein
MVRKTLIPVGLFILGALLSFAGCNQAPAPAYPKDGSTLSLSFPVPKASTKTLKGARPRGVKASEVDLSNGVFEYKISAGSEAVTGSISISSSVTMGTVNIPLPHNGTWLVSAEWLDYGSYAHFVGADQVVIYGLTNMVLPMGDVTLYGCSYNYFTDPGCGYYGDRFVFDSAQVGFSTNGDPGDIQFKYDSAIGTEYITTPNGTSLSFAYLGNGDWVNYTEVPAGTVYYADTETAKTASLGAGNGAMAVNDVYVVQLSPTYRVWVQVSYTYVCGSGAEADIDFRVNTLGYTYMKYDTTTYDKTNCQNLIFGGGGS